MTWTKDIWLEYTSDDGFVVKVELLKGRIAVFNGEVVKTLPMQKGSEFNDLEGRVGELG